MSLTRQRNTEARRVPVHHAHGCLGCGRRYEDTCSTPLANGRCATCRLGHPAPQWEHDHQPQACCKEDSSLIWDKETMEKYHLGGPGPWFKCKTCSRCHPFNPKES